MAWNVLQVVVDKNRWLSNYRSITCTLCFGFCGMCTQLWRAGSHDCEPLCLVSIAKNTAMHYGLFPALFRILQYIMICFLQYSLEPCGGLLKSTIIDQYGHVIYSCIFWNWMLLPTYQTMSTHCIYLRSGSALIWAGWHLYNSIGLLACGRGNNLGCIDL